MTGGGGRINKHLQGIDIQVRERYGFLDKGKKKNLAVMRTPKKRQLFKEMQNLVSEDSEWGVHGKYDSW
jgi:hypothetical protein